MTVQTKPRPIASHQVKTTSIWAGWHSWNTYVGPSSGGVVLRAQAMKDDETGEWVVSTSKDLGETERTEVARVKTLKSVREVMAWLYNQAAGVEDLPTLESVLDQASKTARRKAAPGVTPEEAGVKVGTVFVSTWGYDQTNVDYYEVVGLTPKGVKIRKVSQAVESEYVGSDRVSPVKSQFVGDVETKMLRGSASHPYLSLTSYSTASVWNGKANYQTASGWGH